MPEPLLEVKDLKVHFETEDGLVKAVDGVSFTVSPGETLGVVGESGSGKSVTFLTLMGLIRSKNARIEGQALFQGQDLLKMPQGPFARAGNFRVMIALARIATTRNGMARNRSVNRIRSWSIHLP